jgi:hypothetical protein
MTILKNCKLSSLSREILAVLLLKLVFLFWLKTAFFSDPRSEGFITDKIPQPVSSKPSSISRQAVVSASSTSKALP